MRVVLDTNILRKAAESFSLDHLAVICFLCKYGHYLVLDVQGQLADEYRSEVGSSELYQKWFKEMSVRFQVCWTSGNVQARVATELAKRSLHEPEDQLLVALAIRTDKYIVTEDSDFGKGDHRRAADHRKVLAYLTGDLGLVVHDASEACLCLGSGA